MSTFATMFTGFGGADIGLTAAGLNPLWGIEYRPDIAGVYGRNLPGALLVADVRAVDYTTLPRPDWLHASPVCTRASIANPEAGESPEDGEIASAVVRALRALRPRWFSLENVWGYRNFAAFRLILDTLGDLGYMYDFEHVNAADFGVPQTRRRLILRAVHGALLPALPAPVRWVGWYEAIADLIPTLPGSKLPRWQLQRLPAGRPIYLTDYMIDGKLSTSQNAKVLQIIPMHDPSSTVVASPSALRDARFIVGGNVFRQTTRCLARFQSFPDWYELPAKRTLAAQGIGNAVPPLLIQRIAEQMGVA